MKQKIRTASLLLLMILGTKLIAYPACSRAVLFESLQVPKPAFDLCAHKKKSSSDKITLLLKVDLEGFEPLTSRMRTERSPS